MRSTLKNSLLLVAAATATAYALRKPYRFSLQGKVVLITGGSRGLGLLLARECARQGASIAILARDREELARAAADLERFATPVLPLSCDIRRAAEIGLAVTAVEKTLGAIDVVINNAGVIKAGPFDNTTLEDFAESLDTHLWGPLHLIRAVVPGMTNRRFGAIVNIASIGGRLGVPHLASYCAGKFALVGLSEAISGELASSGIAVTTVMPGLMRTGSHVNAQFKGRHEAEYAWFAALDSLPLMSVDAERAARKIVSALRQGARTLTIGLPALGAAAANGLAPGLVAALNGYATRFLPPAAGAEGNVANQGPNPAASCLTGSPPQPMKPRSPTTRPRKLTPR